MNLQITEVVETKQAKKTVYLKDGLTEYVYDGNHMIRFNNKTNKRYDYYKQKHVDLKPFPKALDKLVAEMDFLLDSLVENDHVRAVIEGL